MYRDPRGNETSAALGLNTHRFSCIELHNDSIMNVHAREQFTSIFPSQERRSGDLGELDALYGMTQTVGEALNHQHFQEHILKVATLLSTVLELQSHCILVLESLGLLGMFFRAVGTLPVLSSGQYLEPYGTYKRL